MKHLIPKTMTAVPVLALALAVGGCGSSGDDGDDMMDDMMVELTPEEMCDAAHGRYESDGSCTSADMLAEERRDMQVTEINSKITAAETAVTGLTDDASDAAISAAKMAVDDAKKAIMDAADVADKSGFDTAIGVVERALDVKETSIMTARDAAAEAMKMAMAKTGKELHAALGPDDAGTTALNNIGAPSLSSAGLVIDATTGAGALATTAGDPDPVTLKAGDSVGSLGGWMGTNYAHTDSGTKVENAAVVYTNRGPTMSESCVEKYGDETEYSASTRTYNVGATADSKIKAAAFPTAGVKTFTGAQDLPGTYDGASGRYKCAAGQTCTATFNAGGIALSDPWTFVHDAGADAMTPDAEYLYFGWWVSKDKDGMPTAASAFAGIVAPTAANLPNGGDLTDANLTGTASYTGNAAGKFAMSNPLDGTGNGGHFTADAMLEATFGGTTPGVTGTIDNFRLNDGSEDPGWSVSLARGGLGSADGEIEAPAASTTGPTVWSIDGNAAPASGTWSGTMYDEMPAGADDDDGSNIPTTVTGTFYSEFSTIGRMAGAFGATKE